MTNEQTLKNSPAVLIVGAGPTGLTLACELARAGVSFRLIEASSGPQPGSRGKGIQPRTLEVFDDLGIVDRVIANGRMSMPMRSTGPDGQVKMIGTEIPVDRADIPYPVTLITPEWRIEESLRSRLTQLGGEVEFDTAFVSHEEIENCVSAVVTHGSKTETIEALWLVGCDGGHSLVRKQAGIAFEGETSEEIRMVVADVQADGIDHDVWQTWSHAEGMVALCPLPSTNTFQFQAGIGPGQNPELSLVNMQVILDKRSGRSDIRLHDPEWLSLWRLNVRIVDRYREGRVLIAGDAAHIHSPAGGQGMNTGIQDAHNLSWKLAAVINGASPMLLDSYESERRPVALGVLALSNERLREAINQKNIPGRRDAATMQLGISYRDSILALDDREETATVRAGDRAPDATKLLTVEGERRLFDLTRGGHFTLLTFGPIVPYEGLLRAMRIFRVVAKPIADGDVVDAEGHLANAYGATNRSLMLIRPDGYIGLISDAGDVEAVQNYLAAIGFSS